jgi:hypothetical protein
VDGSYQCRVCMHATTADLICPPPSGVSIQFQSQSVAVSGVSDSNPRHSSRMVTSQILLSPFFIFNLMAFSDGDHRIGVCAGAAASAWMYPRPYHPSDHACMCLSLWWQTHIVLMNQGRRSRKQPTHHISSNERPHPLVTLL